MNIIFKTKSEWLDLYSKPFLLVDAIEKGAIVIVRNFMSTENIDTVKNFCRVLTQTHEPSWHPCLDGCPDYHRIHENYHAAYVPSIQHGFYFHPWNQNFIELQKVNEIQQLFDFKLNAGRLNNVQLFKNLPSTGPVARLLVHQYPRGGGGQAEHIDPVSNFAKVQTIIMASSRDTDYLTGGFYVNDSKYGVINIDSLMQKGDLLLASPNIKHGVAAIDPDKTCDWKSNDGRWIIMPIIIDSDHVVDPTVRPKKILPS